MQGDELMDWQEKVYSYCERGTDPAFWAEPANALTNGAFIIAAFVAWLRLRGKRPFDRDLDYYVMIGLVGLIGIGSFLFHTLASRWAAIADVGPITLFILVYLAFALNRYLRVPPGTTLLLTIAFMGLSALVMQIRCGGAGGLSVGGAGGRCLNGSLGYMPALVVLWTFAGLLLRHRGHPAAPYMAVAGGVFLVSVTMRSIDMSLCNSVVVGGYTLGTHFVWHVLNAVTLFTLMIAAIEHGRHGLSLQEILPPPRGRPEQDSTQATGDT